MGPLRVEFWSDYWALDCPMSESFPALYALEKNKGCKVNDRLGRYGSETVRNWEWKRRPWELTN